MITFWFIIAIAFVLIEIFTLAFGFIFITIGSGLLVLMLNFNIIAEDNYLGQFLIMLFFFVISSVFFYKTFKKSKESTENRFRENMDAVVIGEDLVRHKEGKIKWSGTICNAILSDNSQLDKIEVGSDVVIESFVGNVAVVNKI